ncbi:PREDICTED: putative cancer susceptibility gene HEPN1 protein, partial [Myotis davidii]|uniref:putative cancer susceptibility gene HEPN1 protein n=1 Tax=Myotis davidii TaxID=225400 RepID=UPI000767BADC
RVETGALGIALWDGGASELELRRLREGPGMQGPLEASENRGQKTQKVSSSSFSIALSPHTADYCLSYKVVHRLGHGPGLATQWPYLPVFRCCVVRESALLQSLGI